MLAGTERTIRIPSYSQHSCPLLESNVGRIVFHEAHFKIMWNFHNVLVQRLILITIEYYCYVQTGSGSTKSDDDEGDEDDEEECVMNDDHGENDGDGDDDEDDDDDDSCGDDDDIDDDDDDDDLSISSTEGSIRSVFSGNVSNNIQRLQLEFQCICVGFFEAIFFNLQMCFYNNEIFSGSVIFDDFSRF